MSVNFTDFPFFNSDYNFARLSWNLSYLLPMLGTVLAPSAAQLQGVLGGLGRGIQKEVAAVKQPIDETIVEVGSSQCSNVKKLIGVDYEQVEGVKEPDLNDLTLLFRSRYLNVTYSLSTVARQLAERTPEPGANLVLYLHGFTDNPTKTNFGTVSMAFLNIGEYNILGLDSSSLIRWFYLRSTTYVRFIGERLAEVLVAMVNKGLNPKSIHLIGHSLGSHIAGYAGKRFAALAGFKVGRISSLDPAGPCFSHIDPKLRLHSEDADFVDVIHTDSGVYGLEDAVGHVDFYPNGGSQQPNCLLQTCSHSRVNELYAEAITNPQAFLAVACLDYEAFKKGNCSRELKVMGYGSTPDTRGKYYLRTGEESPYGLGEAGTRWENNEGIVRNIGSVGAKLFG